MNASGEPTRESGPVPRRIGWKLLVHGLVAIAAVGVFLPLLPTTPFLLLALWAAPKAHPRLRWRLLRHPRYGPALRAWQRERAIPVRAKTLAVFMMTASWVLLWRIYGAAVPVWVTGAIFVTVVVYIVTRPVPRGSRTARRSREDGPVKRD